MKKSSWSTWGLKSISEPARLHGAMAAVVVPEGLKVAYALMGDGNLDFLASPNDQGAWR